MAVAAGESDRAGSRGRARPERRPRRHGRSPTTVTRRRADGRPRRRRPGPRPRRSPRTASGSRSPRRRSRAAPPHAALRDPTTRDGPVRDFEVTHEKRMHLIVVRRDGTRLPAPASRRSARTARGARRSRCPTPGAYRVFADFKRDGEAHTLAADLTVDGAGDLRAVPRADHRRPRPTGTRVKLDADGDALAFAITRDGKPVETEPYLGAGGHLVALREGDLAFLHVHPDRATASRSRPTWTPDTPLPPVPAVQARRPRPHRGVHAMSTTIELPITGMTCASCANRIERKLNKLDGVQRERQLRHREGDRRLRPGGRRARRARRRGRGRGLPRDAAGRRAASERRVDEPASLRLRLILSRRPLAARSCWSR